MKFIKYAVGLVIALSVIPLVVVTANNIDTSKLRTVEFEVIDIVNDTTSPIFSENTFNNIHSLAIVDGENVTNLFTVTVNDVELLETTMLYDHDLNYYYFATLDDSFSWDELNDSNTARSAGYTPTIGDKWTMTFEVSIMPPHIKLLIGLVPLIFVGGILLFMLDKRKKED